MGRLLPLAEDYDQSTAQLEAFVEEGRTGAEISELETINRHGQRNSRTAWALP